ncbi:hypothetical protein M407DRAFT_99756 [Tulasnella calospora MUT 4182]|uniref:Uncharacterized protein n=1 Tax=Tulasnella calospora MUT 4182 TaxID=1051891 RepID=A0A0C3KSV3_9AGAM|nr:hypothetical protein M407DRAFT_99756 [Tulasnella calospora MUT 4182]
MYSLNAQHMYISLISVFFAAILVAVLCASSFIAPFVYHLFIVFLLSIFRCCHSHTPEPVRYCCPFHLSSLL